MTIEHKWTQSEKIIARRAFDRAHESECNTILNKVKEIVNKMKGSKEIWGIEDYLAKERIKVNQKYDYRYSVLIIVFARLMREGFIEEADLEGLQQDKMDRIKAISSLGRK